MSSKTPLPGQDAQDELNDVLVSLEEAIRGLTWLRDNSAAWCQWNADLVQWGFRHIDPKIAKATFQASGTYIDIVQDVFDTLEAVEASFEHRIARDAERAPRLQHL